MAVAGMPGNVVTTGLPGYSGEGGSRPGGDAGDWAGRMDFGAGHGIYCTPLIFSAGLAAPRVTAGKIEENKRKKSFNPWPISYNFRHAFDRRGDGLLGGSCDTTAGSPDSGNDRIWNAIVVVLPAATSSACGVNSVI